MLAGPHGSTGAHHHHHHHHHSSGSGFDISAFRTGFTPDGNHGHYKTGLTPSGSSGSNGLNIPNSPSTAALLALMNQNSGSPREGNYFGMGGRSVSGNGSGEGAFDLAFGRSLNEKRISRLRTSSGREVQMEDDEVEKADVRMSNANANGGKIEEIQVKREENEEDRNSMNRSTSNQNSHPNSFKRPEESHHQPNRKSDQDRNHGQNLDDYIHSSPRNPDVLEHQNQQYQQSSPPHKGQVVPSSSSPTRTERLDDRSNVNSNSNLNSNQTMQPANNKRKNDYDSYKNELVQNRPHPTYSANEASSSSKTTKMNAGPKAKKPRTSGKGSGRKSPEKVERERGVSMVPSESDTVDLEDYDSKSNGKGKDKDDGMEGMSEEAKRKAFLERNRQGEFELCIEGRQSGLRAGVRHLVAKSKDLTFSFILSLSTFLSRS